MVALSGGGSGTGTHPVAVSIAENGTQASFTFNATVAGSYSITASAQNRLPGTMTFTLTPQFGITSFVPASGPVGIAVAVSGAGFDPVPSNNQVRFNGNWP